MAPRFPRLLGSVAIVLSQAACRGIINSPEGSTRSSVSSSGNREDTFCQIPDPTPEANKRVINVTKAWEGIMPCRDTSSIKREGVR